MDLVDPFHDCGTECDADGHNAAGRGDGGDAAVGVELVVVAAAAAVAAAAVAGTCTEMIYLSWARRYSRGLTFLRSRIKSKWK